LPWTEELNFIKERVEAITKNKYSIYVMQRYPYGNIGINPHRDKEMVPGTTICGVSLGQTRVLTMGR
jgi:alkylated DNA repair dioxygenase AlkB